MQNVCGVHGVFMNHDMGPRCASFLPAERLWRRTEFHHREQWHIPSDKQHFWPKPHDEYHSPHWTNWIPLWILPILRACDEKCIHVRDLFEAYHVGFLWIRKWWQTICIIGLWKHEGKATSRWFIQQRNFVSQPVNRACVRHERHNSIPFNQQSNDMLCTLITWLLSPHCWLLCIGTLTHLNQK